MTAKVEVQWNRGNLEATVMHLVITKRKDYEMYRQQAGHPMLDAKDWLRGLLIEKAKRYIGGLDFASLTEKSKILFEKIDRTVAIYVRRIEGITASGDGSHADMIRQSNAMDRLSALDKELIDIHELTLGLGKTEVIAMQVVFYTILRRDES